jgi:hypothetical protein
MPNPQYTVVDASFSYAAVQWEKLEEVYIPEEDPQLAGDTTLIKEIVWEAFTLTGNTDYLPQQKGWSWPSRWRPKGRVRVWDDAVDGLIPVHGARIRVTNFMRWDWINTDANGYFTSTMRVLTKVDYSIRWVRPGAFRITDGIFNGSVTAVYTGPWKKGEWHVDIGGENSTYRSMRYATMHRACMRYF